MTPAEPAEIDVAHEKAAAMMRETIRFESAKCEAAAKDAAWQSATEAEREEVRRVVRGRWPNSVPGGPFFEHECAVTFAGWKAEASESPCHE